MPSTKNILINLSFNKKFKYLSNKNISILSQQIVRKLFCNKQ